MQKILRKIRTECLEILPAFIFFFLMFQVLSLTRALMLTEYGITLHGHMVALLGAVIVAKAIFIADKLPFLNFYPRQPLLLNVLVKTAAFGTLTFLFLFIEELFHQIHKHGSFAAAWERLASDVAWPVFWSGEIWITVLLLFYCAAVELARAVGTERTKAIFFLKQ